MNPEKIDRLLDSAVAVTDAQGRLLGSRDLSPAEKQAPAVTVVVVGDPGSAAPLAPGRRLSAHLGQRLGQTVDHAPERRMNTAP